MSPKIMRKCSKLHFFSAKTSMKCATISFTKSVLNYLKLVNLFGKRHSVGEQLFKWLPKKPPLYCQTAAIERLGSNWIPLTNHPKEPMFFGKGSVVIFDPTNLEAIGNKQAVSDSVFKVTRIIE